MKALIYLTACKYKNKLLELLHKPLKLILILCFAVLLVMNFSLSQGSPSGNRPVYEFRLIVLAFYLVCFITESVKGYKGGSSMFSLADVNLLFTSPIKSSPVFFYGMLGRLKSSLFMGIAFVYQFALLRSFYPITVKDMLIAVIGYGAVAFVSQLAGILLAVSKNGYYEYAVLTAHRNEKNEGVSTADVKVRKNHTGIIRGHGASVLFYKHMLENRRTRSALFSPSSFFYLVLIGVYGFVFEGDFIILFSLSCLVSFLPVLSGRWLKELTMPHVFLIPESPLKKLFYILPEMLPKIITESVLQCVLIGYICKLGALTVLMLIFARASVSFVLIGSSLLAARLLREKEKNSVFLAMSVLPGMLFLLPSVLLCMWTLNFGMGLVIAFSVMIAVNMMIFAVLLFFARNIFKITE